MSEEERCASPAAPEPSEPSASTETHVSDIVRRTLLGPARVRNGIVAGLWNASLVVSTAIGVAYALIEGSVSSEVFGWAVVSAATATALNRRKQDLERARAALALRDLGPEAIPALIDALGWPDRRVRVAASDRLIDLLPTLTEEQAGRLTAEQRARLLDYLDFLHPWNATFRPHLIEAVLRALPVYGDEEARKRVERLALMRGYTRDLRRVRAAARECLPKLEAAMARRRLAASESPTPASQAEPPVSAAEPRAPVPAHVTETLRRVEAEAMHPPQLRLPFLIAAWAILVPASFVLAVQLVDEGYWYAALPVVLIGVWATRLHRLTLTMRHRRIASELAALDDVSAVGSLADALVWPDATLRMGAMAALTRLLPRMRASDASNLTGTSRERLYGMLNQETARAHPDFVLSLLKALEQVGDLAALGPVERLAQARFRSARLRLVSEAARECLPYLRAVAEKNQQSQILLRASCRPGGEEAALLRPAVGVIGSDPERLLRSASAPAEEEETSDILSAGSADPSV